MSFLALLLLLPLAASAGDWDRHWADCADLSLPAFQSRMKEFKGLVREGTAWDRSVTAELASVTHITTVTCKAWAANPNGDEPLRAFVKEYGEASAEALVLKRRADEFFLPTMANFLSQEKAELSAFGYGFEKFPCGKAFTRSQGRVAERVKEIEQGFENLRQQCPKAADRVIAEARAKGLSPVHAVKGVGAGVHGGRSANGASDITGTGKKKEP